MARDQDVALLQQALGAARKELERPGPPSRTSAESYLTLTLTLALTLALALALALALTLTLTLTLTLILQP